MNRVGRIRNVHNYDGTFFGYGPQSNILPGNGILLETTYEAIIDAGT